MTYTLIALFLIYLFYQYADAKGDVAIELCNQKKWHTWGAVTACLFIGVLSYCIIGLNWYLPLVTLGLIIIRLPFFNTFHNLAKGQKWYYVGKTAKTDKLIRKLFPFINFDK